MREIIYPYTYKIEKIIKVIDGDTLDALFDLGFSTYQKHRVRLGGIDTPESRTRDLTEKKFGLLCKSRLIELINNAEEVMIRTTISKGKFGRVLGQIWCDGINVNQLLIDEGHAVEYYGQNKDDIAQAHLDNRKLLVERGVVANEDI